MTLTKNALYQAGLEDAKAEIKADLEFKMDGKGKGVIVDQWKEVLRSMPAQVTQVNPSSVLVKMENGEVTFMLFPESFVIIFEIQVGLQILEEDTMMTKEPRDWATIDPSIGIGDKVRKKQ